MIGLVVILISFILAGTLRVILKKKTDCVMARFIPQLVMLGGGLLGAYLFLQENWNL